MIVQHTDKECKTKFSTGMEFTFSLKEEVKTRKECLTRGLTYDTLVGRMEVGLFFMPKIR